MVVSVRNVTYKQRNQCPCIALDTWKMSYDHTSFTLPAEGATLPGTRNSVRAAEGPWYRKSSAQKENIRRVHPPPTPKPCFFLKVNTSKTETLALNRILYVYEAKTQSQTRMYFDQEPPPAQHPTYRDSQEGQGLYTLTTCSFTRIGNCVYDRNTNVSLIHMQKHL